MLPQTDEIENWKSCAPQQHYAFPALDWRARNLHSFSLNLRRNPAEPIL
jgi:hypothetical protein